MRTSTRRAASFFTISTPAPAAARASSAAAAPVRVARPTTTNATQRPLFSMPTPLRDPGRGLSQREAEVVARVEEGDVPHEAREKVAVVRHEPAPHVVAHHVAEQAAE